MSLHRKLVTLVGFIILIILSSTLAIVYVASQSIMVHQAKQNAVSIISTIDSALDSGIPDFEFEAILLHLKRQEPAITSFDIYKLTGYLYDIASTNPQNIGTRASSDGALAVRRNTVITAMKGNVLQIVAPIHVNGQTVYVASVGFSISHDLFVTRQLLFKVLIVGLVALCCAVIATWLFARQLLSRPLLTIVEAANDIAAGNLTIDLSNQSLRRDEIGVLARSFDKMAQNLRELISGISQTSEQLNQAFKELVNSADHTSRGALHVSDVMHHIAHKMALQTQYSTAVTRAMEDVTATIGSVTVTSAEASESSYGTAQRVREGTDAVSSIRTLMNSFKERAVKTGQDHEELLATYRKMQSVINQLFEAAHGQDEFPDVITDLATGCVGWTETQKAQFRQLADQMALLLTEAQNHIQKAAIDAERSNGQIATILNSIEGAGQLLSDVAPLTQRVADDMQGISDIIKQISDESYNVLTEMERVEEVARDSGADLHNIAATVEGQLGSIQEVNRSATQLSQMAMELRELVSIFDLM